MPAQQFPQSEQPPYITVGQDLRGSACWLVVTADQIIECPNGHRALVVLEAAIRSKKTPSIH
jgi:hypothetical protein